VSGLVKKSRKEGKEAVEIATKGKLSKNWCNIIG
jgi:hypothetical protein